MMRPPAILRIALRREDGRRFGLWVPLFLLWPILLAFVVVLVPPWVLAGLAMWVFTGRKRLLQLPWRAAHVLCRLPGLVIDVEASGEKVICVRLS